MVCYSIQKKLRKIYLEVLNLEDVEIIYTKKSKIKNIKLKILCATKLEVTFGHFCSKQTIFDFISTKQKWIFKKLNEFKNREYFEQTQMIFGAIIVDCFEGKNYEIFLQNELNWYLKSSVENYSKIMQVEPSSITIKKLKAIWGSCDFKNNLKFNSSLAKFPREIIDYVVVHELAHIKYKHHQKPFWDFVEFAMPDYKQRRQKLKKFTF